MKNILYAVFFSINLDESLLKNNFRRCPFINIGLTALCVDLISILNFIYNAFYFKVF